MNTPERHYEYHRHLKILSAKPPMYSAFTSISSTLLIPAPITIEHDSPRAKVREKFSISHFAHDARFSHHRFSSLSNTLRQRFPFPACCASRSPRPLAHSPSRAIFPMYTRRDDVARICTARPKGSLQIFSHSGTSGNSSMDTTQARGRGSLQSFRYSSRITVFRSAAEQRHF